MLDGALRECLVNHLLPAAYRIDRTVSADPEKKPDKTLAARPLSLKHFIYLIVFILSGEPLN